MLASTRGEVDLEARAFRVARRIRTGSTSSIFEIEARHGARLAVKVLFSDDPATRVRFLLGAAAQSRVRHENVAPFLELVRTPSGLPCIVMPLLVGCSLREQLRTMGRLAPERACGLVGEALRGLDAIHRAGIVHREVTPSNVFVGRVDRESRRAVRAIVTDFGVAKVDDLPVAVPAHALSRLEAAYLAPEILLGERVDGRADVYAAGVVLFEAITGRPPFVGPDRAAVMEAHLDRTPPRLDLVAGASPSVADVVARALEKRPSHRWESARAFARALDAAVAT